MTSAGGLRLLAVPALVFLCLFFFYPLVKLFLLSLQAPDFTLNQYHLFFSNPAYVEIGLQTITLSGLVTLICLILGYPAAAFIASARTSIQKYLLICVVVPYLTSLLVRTYAWIVLLNDHGLLNRFALFVGLTDRPLPLLYTRTAVLIAMVHIMLPFMVLPIYAVMRGMDGSLMRASAALGAGPLRSFIQVFLPYTLPGVRSGCILVFVISLGFYITPAALGGLNDTLLSTLIEGQVTGALNFPFAAAIGFLLLAATLGLYFLLGGAQVGAGSLTSTSRSPATKGRWVTLERRAINGSGLLSLSALVNRFAWERRVGRRTRLQGVGELFRGVSGSLSLAFLILPSIIVVTISFSADEFLTFPPAEWSLRWYRSYFGARSWLEPTWLSFQLALVSAALSLALGIPAAYALVRTNLAGASLLYAVILAPIIVPTVVAAVAIYGVLADWRLLGTYTGLLVAHTCGGITYVVTVVSASLVGLDRRLELASLSLGAGPARTFRLVIFPLIKPSVIAGALFAFIHSFDEVVLTSFIAGIRLQTLPLKMWEDIRHQVDPTIAAVSGMLVIIPLLWLPLMRQGREVR